MLSKIMVFSLLCVYTSWGAADRQAVARISPFVCAVAKDVKFKLGRGDAFRAIDTACELLPHIQNPYEELYMRMLLVKGLETRSNKLSVDMSQLIRMHKQRCNALAISLAPFDCGGTLVRTLQALVNQAPSESIVHYCISCWQTFATKRGSSIHKARVHDTED